MNFDKKRRSRVQGGWAATAGNKSNKPALPRPDSVTANQTAVNLGRTVESEDKQIKAEPGSRVVPGACHAERGRAQPLESCVGDNINLHKARHKFVYEEPHEEIQTKPSDIVITKPGVYDISTGPTGVSRLRYFPDFISPSRCEEIFSELHASVPWRQRHDVHHGVRALRPRLSVWYGDVDFRYGGVTQEPIRDHWPQAFHQLKQQLQETTGLEFNSLVTNLYRDNHDSIGWHCDDADIFGPTPVIASLSFGEERNFELRKIPPKDGSGDRDFTYSQVVRVPISPGALLIMEGYTQSDWQHRVPKEYHDRGARINVTFRIVSPIADG